MALKHLYGKDMELQVDELVSVLASAYALRLDRLFQR